MKEAERLAEALDVCEISKTGMSKAAAELRRLSAINAELEADLLKIARMAEALKRPCSMEPESPQAIRNSEYMNISYVARLALEKAKQ